MSVSQPNQNKSSGEGGWWLEACSGCAATIPMTLFMLATQRTLPRGQRYALPPELITKELASRARIRVHLGKKQLQAATLLSHFAYGTVVGTLYRPLEKKMPVPALAKGSLFGLLVWLASYFGLLPLLGLSESGHQEPRRRNLMMAVAHILWGAALGRVAEMLVALARTKEGSTAVSGGVYDHYHH